MEVFNEPKITLVEKAPWLRYTLNSQDTVGIDNKHLKHSCSTNSMNDNINSMPCSFDKHDDRLEFLENDEEAIFILEPTDFMPK